MADKFANIHRRDNNNDEYVAVVPFDLDGNPVPAPTGPGGATENTLQEVGRKEVRSLAKVEFIPHSGRPTTIYRGVADAGTADSTSGWRIFRTTFTYDGTTNNATDIVTDTADAVAWDDRATETYT